MSPDTTLEKSRRRKCRSRFTAVEVDGSNELQVRVYPPNAVHISTVLQTRTDRRLIQVSGFALQPDNKQTRAQFYLTPEVKTA